MRRQDDGASSAFCNFRGEQGLLLRETGQSIGVEHDRGLARQRRAHELAHCRPDAAARPERYGVSARVGQEFAKLPGAVDGVHHDGEARRSVDGKRVTGRCNGDQPRPRPQCPARR